MSELTPIDKLVLAMNTEIDRLVLKYGISAADSEEVYYLMEKLDDEDGHYISKLEDLNQQIDKLKEDKLRILSEIDTVSTTVLAAHKLLNSVCDTTEKIVKRKQGDHTF